MSATASRIVSIVASVLVAACASDSGGEARSSTYSFGPFNITPHQEVVDSCVQITLNNAAPVYVSSVELTTGPGFHHSNWLFVPETQFPGDDGVFRCSDRAYNEAIAAAYGGVLFAQSTQAPHEIQAFPSGLAVKIPERSKLVAQIHLLNPQDSALHLTPTIALTSVKPSSVSTVLSAISFEDQALGLPAHKQSRFTVDCDLAPTHTQRFGRLPDFKLYYALAHYHALGTGLTLEAVKADGTATTVFTTAQRVGDSMGGPVTPAFDMTGYTRLRLSCNFTNPRDSVVAWGVGDQEMCVFLAFSDSDANWGGGTLSRDPPGEPTILGDGTMAYSHACNVFALDAHR